MDISLPPPHLLAGIGVVLLVLMSVLAGGISGWRRLARHYPAAPLRDGDRLWVTAFLRRGRYQGLIMRAGATHLHVAVFPLFRVGHPPFSVPWHDITAARARKCGFAAMRFTLAREPDVPILVSARIGARIVDASRGQIQLDPAWDVAEPLAASSPAGWSGARLATGLLIAGALASLAVMGGCIVLVSTLYLLDRAEDADAASRAGLDASLQRPLVSQDGEILLVSALENRRDILLVRADGSNLRQIATLGSAQLTTPPVWSSDGVHIAYATDAVHVLRVGDESVDSIFTFGGGGSPAWSPDGRRLAFLLRGTDRKEHLFIYDLAARTLQDIAAGWPRVEEGDWHAAHSLAWSPDGQRLAFVRTIGVGRGRGSRGYDEIYLAGADGSGLTHLPRRPGAPREVSALAWAPDSRRLACISGMEVETIDVQGNPGGRWPAPWSPESDMYATWSPDGSTLAWFTRRGIVSISTGDAEPRELTPGRQRGAYPAWSPDGTRLAFSCDAYAARLCVMNADGSGLTEIIDLGAQDSALAVRHLRFPVWRPGAGSRDAP